MRLWAHFFVLKIKISFTTLVVLGDWHADDRLQQDQAQEIPLSRALD